MNSEEPINPWIRMPQLQRARRAPNAVLVNDVSLREGEQCEGISFDLATKVDLARALESAGVPQIQVGYPGRFERDLEATRAVRAALTDSVCEVVALAFVDDWEHEIDACVASGADI